MLKEPSEMAGVRHGDRIHANPFQEFRYAAGMVVVKVRQDQKVDPRPSEAFNVLSRQITRIFQPVPAAVGNGRIRA